MARFLKQSLIQTCLKETDNGKLHPFIIEMSPRFVLGQENVPCVTEVVNRSLKADWTDFTLDSLHQFISVIQNKDFRTFRPVAIIVMMIAIIVVMIVKKAKNNAYGSCQINCQ